MVEKRRAAPPRIVAGVGFRTSASASEIIALVEASLLEAGRSVADLACLATLAGKHDAAAIQLAARHFALSVLPVTAEVLQLQATAPTAALALKGIRSIAEAAAASQGRIVLDKRKSSTATCALAER